MKDLDMLRNGMDVERFHTIPLAGRQTVGHHTANLIGLIFLAYRPAMPPVYLLHAALVHDMPEAWTGDLPADVKKIINLKYELKDVEYEYLAETLWQPEELTGTEQQVLKVCDCLELVLYLNNLAAGFGFNRRVRGMYEKAVLYLIKEFDMLPLLPEHTISINLKTMIEEARHGTRDPYTAP